MSRSLFVLKIREQSAGNLTDSDHKTNSKP